MLEPQNIRRRSGNREAVLAETRASLRHRLEDRRPEIEAALATRLSAIASTKTGGPEHAERRKSVHAAAFDYTLAVIAQGESKAPGVPLDLLIHARSAARSSIPLETVLRKCFAGYAVLSEFVLDEAQNVGSAHSSALRQLLQGQSALFDRLIEALSEEYRRERGRRQSRGEHFANRIKRLVEGEMLDTSDIDYDLDGHHIAGIGQGNGVTEAAYSLSRKANRRLLIVQHGEGVWVWFGGKTRLTVAELVDVATEALPSGTSFAFGEAMYGLDGWRLSHRQAKATLPVAQRVDSPGTRYGDVALLASVLRDPLLLDSLREQFLRPLDSERDRGAAARDTLNAYFAVDRNISSAAAKLGVKRHTVTRRLRAVEQRLGRSLVGCATEMELALKLERLAIGT
jgi:hypothetical protein